MKKKKGMKRFDSRSCVNCLFCKLNGHKQTIRCSKSRWNDINGEEKVIMLYKAEISGVNYNLYPRKVFNTGIICEEFEGSYQEKEIINE